MTTQPVVSPAQPGLTEALEAVISHILVSAAPESAQLLSGYPRERLEQAVQDVHENAPEHFFFHWTHPHEQATQALLTPVLGHSPDVLFLFEHHSFVQAHLAHVYATFEGGACSFDKASWAIAALTGYFRRQEPIAPNLEQQYTFHLPKKVLRTQESLLGFLRGLQGLQYGNPTVFLQQMAQVAMAARAGSGPMA